MTGEIPVTHTRLTMSHYHFKRTQPTINEPVYNNRGQKRDGHYDKENDIHRLAKPEFDTIPKKHPQTQQKNSQEPPCDRGRGSPINNRGFPWIQRRLIRSRKEPVVMCLTTEEAAVLAGDGFIRGHFLVAGGAFRGKS